MHESSLIASLLQQVEQLVSAQSGGEVHEISLDIGLLAGVEPVLLREAFERFKQGTVAKDAVLTINSIGVEFQCRACAEHYRRDELRFDCPGCGSTDVSVVAGDCVILNSITLVR